MLLPGCCQALSTPALDHSKLARHSVDRSSLDIDCCCYVLSKRSQRPPQPLERKSVEKFPKSTLRTFQIDQNRCPRAMLDRSRRPDGPPESILARSRRLDGRPETLPDRSSVPDALPEAILARSGAPGRCDSFAQSRGPRG